MKKFSWSIYVGCAVALFSACTTLQSISYERLQAADVNFPEQIRAVGVINNMPKLNLDSLLVDSSSGLLEGDGKVVAETIAQEIAATNYFNQVVICDSALRSDVPESGWNSSLSVEKIDSLTQALGVDLLFSVERVQIQLAESSLFIPELMASVPALDGEVTPVVRTYLAGRSTPLFSFSKTDTICWKLTPGLTYEQIVKEASEYAATMPMKYLLPYWTEVERYYFDGGNVNMTDAGVYVREQNWEEAYPLWKELYDTKKGKVKMRAAYNLALYYEMQDDFERAKEFMDTALDLAPEGSWEKHLIQLSALKMEELARANQRVQIQMKRFGP